MAPTVRAGASSSAKSLETCTTSTHTSTQVCRHMQWRYHARLGMLLNAATRTDSTLRVKQPRLLLCPNLRPLQASATFRPCLWSILAACIHTSHHGRAVPAAGLCKNRTPHIGQSCRLHASMPQTTTMRCLLQASVPARLCSCSSLAVCSTYASQHDHMVPAAGICSDKSGRTQQQACCLQPHAS